MKLSRALGLFLKSRLHLTLLAVLGGAVLVTLLLAPESLAMVAPFALVLYAIVAALLLLSGRGAQAVVDEAEEERRRRVLERLDQVRGLRDRLSFLRLGDEEVRRAVEHFLLVSGEYLERCNELVSYAPPCNQAIAEALEIVQAYQQGLDGAATERRYAVDDPRAFAEYRERTVAALRERARLVQEKSLEFFDELTPEERLRVLEELDDLEGR